MKRWRLLSALSQEAAVVILGSYGSTHRVSGAAMMVVPWRRGRRRRINILWLIGRLGFFGKWFVIGPW